MSVEERDQHTGYLTTGHDWNGIKELNRPVPKIVWLFLLSTFACAVLWWVLMPAWPLGTTYTRGLLGADQQMRVSEEIEQANLSRKEIMTQISDRDFDQIQQDKALMRYVESTGKTLFGDNCAACHGTSGQGGPGYPSLTDNAWLWGGGAEDVEETIRVGINTEHDDARASQMLAFGREGVLNRDEISNVVTHILTLSQPETLDEEQIGSAQLGKEVFAENCSSCHGADGKGDPEVGAPNLTDNVWIYGSDRQSIYSSVTNGRQGQMPSWETRFSELDRKILTLYVLSLGGTEK